MKYKKTFSLEEIQLKMEYFCAYRERCTSEVKQKLWTFELSETEKTEILQYLEEHNFVNNERYVQQFIQSKVNVKKDGAQKIVYALRGKHIPDELIQKYIGNIDTDNYVANLKKIIESKRKILAPKAKSATDLKQKLMRYLMQKGYAYEDFKSLV